jgi:Arc/MetJ-type ribon-helix-helix transcriptional regulator
MGKKATFVLDEQIMLKAKEVVNKGFFKSMNAFVETAIRDELERIEKENIKAAIIEASKDPLFLSDLEEIEKDFEYVDFEEAEK